MAKKKTTKKKSTKKNKKVGNDNVKSYMKMLGDMETAVYGLAGELRYDQKKEITATQLVSQSIKYLKSYALGAGVDLKSVVDKTIPIANDYSVTSVEEKKRLQKLIDASDDLSNKVNNEMLKAKRRREKTKNPTKKKSTRKKSTKKKSTKKKTSKPKNKSAS
jgi:hypothetical protein